MATEDTRHPLDRLAERHKPLGAGGYVWIVNVGSLESDPLTVAPGYVLRRADEAEIEEIRFLQKYNQLRSLPRNPWETVATQEAEPPGRFSWRPAIEPKYFVLAFSHSTANEPNRLCAASALGIGPVLDIGYSIHRESPAGFPFGVSSPRSLERIAEDLAWKDDTAFATFTEEHAADLFAVFERFQEIAADSEAERIERYAGEFLSLRDIPHRGMRLLGYFTLIESVLTHKPDPQDRYQSLTRQIKKKMALLSNRFVRRFDYAQYVDPAAKSDKVWDSMYELRSVVAHGGKPSFSDKKLVMLRSQQNAEALAADAVRSLLRQLLEEPRLVNDLKDC